MAARKSLIVELADAEGNRGYGESAPFELPFYSSETIASARACLTDLLLPSVIQHPLTAPADCRERLAQVARRHTPAHEALEVVFHP